MLDYYDYIQEKLGVRPLKNLSKGKKYFILYMVFLQYVFLLHFHASKSWFNSQEGYDNRKLNQPAKISCISLDGAAILLFLKERALEIRF